jgi:TolB-like protein/Tfp pilus assembly protein PilF
MPHVNKIVRFGTFEADFNGGELREHGLRIRLPRQAFQILDRLLAHPGAVVTRAELRQLLWPGRSYMDFDHGLNKAVNRLREALGDDAANPRFIQTVARRGYRFLAPIAQEPDQAAPRRIRLAVLPFENLGPKAEQEFFGDGLTEEMISELGRLSPARLGIIARTSAMQYKHSDKRVDEIGRELNVDYILEGSVRCMEGRVRITVQLIQVDDQTHLWAQSYDRDLADIFQVQREVASRVADSLAFELVPEFSGSGKIASPHAYEAYLRGRYFWNRGSDSDARIAIEYFQRALQHDPSYALAWSAMADCYGRLVWYAALSPADGGELAKAAATRALELDPGLGEAHASLALVLFWYDWRWPEAENEFRRAAELAPNNADAHNWYAAHLNVMGRFDEAASQQRIAEELDPLSLTIAMNAADPSYFARRYDQAIEHLKSVLTREPRFIPAHYNLGRAYAAKGDYEEALSAFETAARLSGNRQASAAQAYACARTGRLAEAKRMLEEMERLSKTRYLPAPQLGLIYLGLEEPEKALDLLEQGFEEKSYWMIYLRADPLYDGLRSHQRFTRLIERLKFGPPTIGLTARP